MEMCRTHEESDGSDELRLQQRIRRRSMRALTVDDSRVIRRHLCYLLEEIGFACDEAAEAEGALNAIARSSEAFDLLLLDINMPGMNGMECLRAFRRSHPGAATRVMMVTTEADHPMITRALESGADEFLMKPFTAESLHDKLSILGFALPSDARPNPRQSAAEAAQKQEVTCGID
jgi:two-component system chemotaxis response regulator CheY